MIAIIRLFNLILYVTILAQLSLKTQKRKRIPLYYDDKTPPKFYITGDKHRNFENVKRFCLDMNTKRKDVLIVLGDVGFN